MKRSKEDLQRAIDAAKQDVTFTAMCAWEYLLGQEEHNQSSDVAVYTKIYQNKHGVNQLREKVIEWAKSIETGWAYLPEYIQEAYREDVVDSPDWDWQIVPSLCDFIIENDNETFFSEPIMITMYVLEKVQPHLTKGDSDD